MPLARADKTGFHDGQRRRVGQVFEITEGQAAYARKRKAEGKQGWFTIVVMRPAPPVAVPDVATPEAKKAGDIA